jgi:hypothetical protein
LYVDGDIVQDTIAGQERLDRMFSLAKCSNNNLLSGVDKEGIRVD